VDWIRPWWQQPDHYRWLSAYLSAHDLQRFTRYMMAAVVAALAAVPILILLSTSGPEGYAFRVTAIAVSTCCLGMAVMWLNRWPTQRQSIVFAVAANACIAAICVAQTHPGAGIQTCAAFAALAGYVAFFHSSRLLVLTLAIAAVTAAICTFRLSPQVDYALASSKLIVLCVSVLAVPFSAQVLVRILGIDALNSHIDPLTHLPNRRSFQRSVHTLIAGSFDTAPARLAIVMIDLDGFKRINDTAGHAAGDRILVGIGDILRQTRLADSVIARFGGEEFIVAVVGSEQNAIGLAERLRTDIARLPGRVTASIGVASAPFARLPEPEMRSFADDLVDSADQAMYQAKRSGGDQVYVVGRAPIRYPMLNPAASNTTATNGNAPWITADRAFSGADATNTMAAASIEPTPAKIRAAPTAVPPELIQATPTTVTIAKKRL
jgi:diguanylate cyclase (GGDEF)-like protein